MLAARGVSLGLGKINLSELNQLPINNRALLGQIHRKKNEEKLTKFIIKKHIDKKTLWTACRAVIGGSLIIALGLVMTILGYFDRDFSTTIIQNPIGNSNITISDDALRYKLKSMQYIGPILMGIGMFLLIIACVITLESRDKHAQIIQDESSEFRRSKRFPLISSLTCTSFLPNEALINDDVAEILPNYIPKNDGNLEEIAIVGNKTTPKPNGNLNKEKKFSTNNNIPIFIDLSTIKNLSNKEIEKNSMEKNSTTNNNDEIFNSNIPTKIQYKKKIKVEAVVHIIDNNNIKNSSNLINSFSTYTNNNNKSRGSMSTPNLRHLINEENILKEIPQISTKSIKIKNLCDSQPSINNINNELPILRSVKTTRKIPKGMAPLVHVDSIVELNLIETTNL